ncbi:MAG TPA: hypothetical protein VFY45_05230 [Baekduia sp.]|nr:hypothetical protein [Baekduia sp.]
MSTTNATPSRRPTPAREDATIWELGDHHRVAREVIAAFGPELVAACAMEPGARVLDVGPPHASSCASAAQASGSA